MIFFSFFYQCKFGLDISYRVTSLQREQHNMQSLVNFFLLAIVIEAYRLPELEHPASHGMIRNATLYDYFLRYLAHFISRKQSQLIYVGIFNAPVKQMSIFLSACVLIIFLNLFSTCVDLHIISVGFHPYIFLLESFAR